MPALPWNSRRVQKNGLLNKIRYRGGNEVLLEYFRRLSEEYPEKASALINEETTGFSLIYLLRQVIEEKGLSGSLNPRNREALSYVNNLMFEDSKAFTTPDEENFNQSRSYIDCMNVNPSTRKWILETGKSDDGLDEHYDEILDNASIILLKVHKDKTAIKDVTDIIFKRHRRGSYYHDLVWGLFETADPCCLDNIVRYLCSSDYRDVELARKLLNFIPCFDANRNVDVSKQYAYCRKWLDENRENLFYVGEGFQQTDKPRPFIVLKNMDAQDPDFSGRPSGGADMISIANGGFDMDGFIDTYQPDSFGMGILKRMHEGSEGFNYRSPEQLAFEIKLRRNLVNAARDLNGSGFAFRVFRKSMCNEEYWNRTGNGGFELRNGVKPYDAIRDIYVHGTRYGTECATAIVIVVYKALADAMPETLFNRLFPDIYLMDWQNLDPKLGIEDYHRDPVYLPGDCRYFKNPDVNPMTPEWQGENVIDLGNGLYWGHGIGIGNAERMIYVLNRKRIPGSDRTAYLMDSVRRPDFKYLADRVSEYSAVGAGLV